MKAVIVMMVGAFLALSACGKKADVVPPPGYKLPPHQSESK